MRWDGSVAVITGASRGIGRAVARAAAERGAQVGLISRSQDELDAVLKEVGGRGAASVADVSRRDDIERAISELESVLGPADILVNNAGIGAWAAFNDEPVETFERLMRINYLGTIYAMKAVLPGMLARGRGHIVNVASIAGRIGSPFEAAYSASKFAVVGLSEAVAIEVGNKGVGVSIVDPGPVDTDFFDARGVPYARSTPKPVSAERVARDVIRVVEKNKLETFIPRWLQFAAISRLAMPPIYRTGTTRAFRKELGGK
jgi:short-subunit dehydrogenase